MLIETVNLDPDGSDPIPWSRAAEQLAGLQPAGGRRGPRCWLSTTHPAGRPHVTGAVGHWLDDLLFFVSGPATRKARKLALDPRCTFAISLPDLDLVLERFASRVTDAITLNRVAHGYDARGWPLAGTGNLVTASFWVPSAVPPRWHLYAFTPTVGVGVATAARAGATRWRLSYSSSTP
jgi:hypothetical protein